MPRRAGEPYGNLTVGLATGSALLCPGLIRVASRMLSGMMKTGFRNAPVLALATRVSPPASSQSAMTDKCAAMRLTPDGLLRRLGRLQRVSDPFTR